MKNIIRKILKEDRRQMFLDKIVHVMKNDYPLFTNMEDYGFHEQLSGDELIYVFSGIFGEPIFINKNFGHLFIIYDDNGNEIYFEDLDNGFWKKSEYDERGNVIYYEIHNGFWVKKEYDENGNMLYYENSRGEIRDNR